MGQPRYGAGFNAPAGSGANPDSHHISHMKRIQQLFYQRTAYFLSRHLIATRLSWFWRLKFTRAIHHEARWAWQTCEFGVPRMELGDHWWEMIGNPSILWDYYGICEYIVEYTGGCNGTFNQKKLFRVSANRDTSSNLRYGKDADKAEFYLGWTHKNPISKPSIVKFSGALWYHGISMEKRLRPNTLTLLTYLTLNHHSKTLPWSTDLCKRWVNMCWPNNNPWYGKKVVRKVTSLLVLSASRVSHFMPWFTIIIFTFDIVRL